MHYPNFIKGQTQSSFGLVDSISVGNWNSAASSRWPYAKSPYNWGVERHDWFLPGYLSLHFSSEFNSYYFSKKNLNKLMWSAALQAVPFRPVHQMAKLLWCSTMVCWTCKTRLKCITVRMSIYKGRNCWPGLDKSSMQQNLEKLQ